MNKKEALAEFLELDEIDEIEEGYNENTFDADGCEYMVLTDDEADEMAEEYICDSLWAFDTNFILQHSNLDWSQELEDAIRTMQKNLCEGANEAIRGMIEDLDEFIKEAISADGRGHFLNTYDGEENEQGEYYIYRTN